MRRRDLITGAGFFLVAAVLRCAFVASVASHPAVRFPMLDSRSYHVKALRILGGEWLGDSVFYQDPLSPYFFAGLYGVFGVGSVGVLLAQAVLDAGTVWLVFLLARRVFGYAAAVGAAALATCYKLFFYYDALLLKVALTVFLITLALHLAVRAVERDRGRDWLAAGFCLGLAALTRGNYLLFIPVLVVFAAWSLRGAAAAHVRRTAAMAFGLAAAILPVTLRNHAVSGDFVLVTSQAGQNFYIGSFRGNDTGRYKPPPFLRANPFYEETDFREEALRRTGGREMRPSELSRYWFREGLAEIAAAPMGFARHTLKKADLFFNHYEVPATNSFYFFRDEVAPVLGLPAPTWGALLPLALCGMFFARRNPRAQLLLLFFFTYALTVILTFNMSRYRMPVVPVMIVFAAGGAVALAERVRQRRIAAVAAAAAFLALAYPAVERDVTHDNYAANHLNLGVQHADQARRLRAQALQDERDGDAPAARQARDRAAEQEGLAEAQFRAGLEIQPGHPGLRDVLGKLLLGRVRERERAGRYEDALAMATDLTATLPGFADGHVALGRAYFGLGRFGEARAALRRALELSPNHPEASAELALVIEFERAGGSR